MCEQETGIQRKCWNALLLGKLVQAQPVGRVETSQHVQPGMAVDSGLEPRRSHMQAHRVIGIAGDDVGHATKSTGIG